jgi:hypothetical protein
MKTKLKKNFFLNVLSTSALKDKKFSKNSHCKKSSIKHHRLLSMLKNEN